MKILYVVTGIGYGDSTREHANIVALKKKYPRARIMVAGYDNSYAYFRDKYNTIRIRGYKLPGKYLKINTLKFGLRNLFLPAFWVLGTLKVRLEAFDFIPDLIVSDFEPVGISLARVLNKKCVVVFGYDPEQYKEYAKKHKVNLKMKVEAKYFDKLYDEADIVVIPKFKKPRKKHLLYSYTNPIVRIEPNKLKSEKELMKELKLKKKPILVTLGGSDFGTELATNINKIAPSLKDNFVIFGGNLDLDFADNVDYIRYSPKFLKYLKVCKGVITLAGHKTLSEALIYKKPILCFPIQDHIEQILNAHSLKDSIMVSQNSSEKHLKKLLPQFIKDSKKLEAKVKKSDVKSNGAQEMVRHIELALGKKLKRISKKGLRCGHLD